MNRQRIIPILLLISVIIVVTLLFRLTSNIPSPEPKAPTPTISQTPVLNIKEYINLAKTYSFKYPENWIENPLAIREADRFTTFTECGGTVLSLSEIPALNSQTKKKITAEDYLGITKDSITPSKIDGRRALIFSSTATASAIIEATDSASLLEFTYYNPCNKDFQTAKTEEFFVLLSYFKFL